MVIERDQEISTLQTLIDQARTGRGRIVLLSGDAGMGKTALLSTLRHNSDRTIRWVWGGCDALFTPRPLGPLHDMAHALGERVTKLLKSGSERGLLFDAVLSELEKTRTPIVLVCEDMHWADHATLDLLRFLGRRVAFLKVVIVITFRSDEVSPRHPLTQVIGDLPSGLTTRVTLEPLSPEGVSALAAKAEISADDLFDITDGNPFFVTEILATPDKNLSTVPASIRDAVASRFSRLSPKVREFLETISVMPSSMSAAFLQDLIGPEATALSMRATQNGVLVQGDDDVFRFRHDLARLATLERISASDRRRSHAKIFEVLSKNPTEKALDQIVHHAAGALNGAAMLEYGPLAATTAARAGSHREAAAHLASTLKFVDEAEPEQAARLYESWAYEASLAARMDAEVLDARKHATTLWRALGRLDKVGENLRWLSRLHWYRGEAAEAARYADQAIQVLENIPASSERAMAYSLRSQLHMLNDQMDEAVSWGERALALEREFNDVEVKVHALNNVGTALVFRSNSKGRDMLEESLALSLKHGFHEHAARAYTNLAEYAVEFREFDLAENMLTDGIAYDSEHDLDAWIHYLSGRLAQLRMDQGRLSDAVTISEGAISLDRLSLLMKLPALLVLARVKMRMGSADANALMAKALKDALATDELQYIVPARLTLVEAAWVKDQPELANEHMEELLRLSHSDRHPWNIGELAMWVSRLRARQEVTSVNNLPYPYRLEIEGDYEGAAKAWEDLGLPYAAACARLQSRRPEALPKAVKVLQDIGADAVAAKARRLADVLGIQDAMPKTRRGPYKASRNHPLGLTTREQDVLQLVAKGLTNREISEVMSRSQRTIEHHVSAILGKLNAANRMAAMLRVQNEPWLLSSSA